MKRSSRAGLAATLTLATGLTVTSSQSEALLSAEPATHGSIAPKARDNLIACGLPEAMVQAPDDSTIQALGILLVADRPADVETRYRVITFPDRPNAEEGVAFYRTNQPGRGSSVGVAALTREAQRSTGGVHRVQVPLTDVNRYVAGVVFVPLTPAGSNDFKPYGADALPTTASDIYSRNTLAGAAQRREYFGQGIKEC